MENFEISTYGLTGHRSASELHPNIFSDPGGTRTHDSRIKSPLLCQLSYEVNLVASTGFEPVIFALKERRVDQLLYNAICRVYGS